jgi:hypothetical protein
MNDASPSMSHVGGLAVTVLPSFPWKSTSYSKMCVSSCWTSCSSFSSVVSIGRTMRFFAGSANAPTPSGMKFKSTFVCSKAEWVA